MTMLPGHDSQLLERSVLGEAAAFSTLVRRYQNLVCAVSYSCLGDVALSEDVAQETFVVAWKRLAEVRDSSKLKSWLCAIARNLSLNLLRREGREAKRIQQAASTDGEQVATPLDHAISRESATLVWDALRNVPETYREPLVLFYREDKSVAQVANSMGLSEQAVKVRLHRGRNFLKQNVMQLVEATLGGSRPSKAFAAGVVAAIATLPATSAQAASHAALGKGLLAMKAKTKLLIVSVAVLLAVTGAYVWLESSDGANTPATKRTHASQPTPVATPETAVQPEQFNATRTRPGIPNASKSPKTSMPSHVRPPRVTTIPDKYELTVVSSTTVAVNLSGGASGVMNWRGTKHTPTSQHRFVAGQVTNEAGTPVVDAVVLTGSSIRQLWDSLIAAHGAITNRRGQFRIPLPSGSALEIIAIHPEHGWSSVSAVPAGDDNAAVNLKISGPSELRGHVQRAGKDVDATLSLQQRGTSLVQQITSSPDGDYIFPLLAPGHYMLTARLRQSIGGGISRPVEKSIVIAAGDKATVDFELPAGGVMAVIAIPPKGTKPTIVEYTLIPSAALFAKPLALETFTRSPKGKSAKTMLLGGVHSNHIMQFHDLEPKLYTVCVHAQTNQRKTLGFACKHTTVDTATSVHEVTIKLPATAMSR